MATGEQFVSAARRYIGTPYLWGGKTATGLDCSGLITLALADLGVPFVHGSSAQIAACVPIGVAEGWDTPGALLWREGHDAISTGAGTAVEAIRPAVAETQRTETYAGGPRFTRAGLIPGITYSGGDGMSVMIPLADGRVTSKFNPNRVIDSIGRSPHLGIDLGTGRGYGQRVIAPVSGTITRVVSGRRKGQSASSGTVLAPGRSGNGCVIDDRVLVGHVAPTLKVGDRVKQGETWIGVTDDSGIQTGAHVHLEVWGTRKVPGSARNFESELVSFKHIPPPTPGPTPPKPTPGRDWFDMATAAELLDVVKQAFDSPEFRNNVYAPVWVNPRWTVPGTTRKENPGQFLVAARLAAVQAVHAAAKAEGLDDAAVKRIVSAVENVSAADVAGRLEVTVRD